MNTLNIIKNEKGLMVDSRQVAEMVGKRHDHLLRDIDGYVEILKQSDYPDLGNGLTLRVSDFFILGHYETLNPPRKYKAYFLTRKGCDMVANKMTGQKGVLFTATYVTKFDEMEKSLSKLEQKRIDPNETKRLRAEAMNLNARTRQAKLMKDLALQFQDALSQEAIHLLVNGITEFLIGKSLLPMANADTNANTNTNTNTNTYTCTDNANNDDDGDIPF